MRKKNLLIAVSFGLFTSLGFSQNQAVNKADENFKQKIKNGLDKEEPINAKSTGVFIPEWRLTNFYDQNDEDFYLGSRNLYFYQNSNELVEDLVENYDQNASDYVPSYRTLYMKTGNWEINLTENWDATEEEWYGTYVDSSEYNAQGDRIVNLQWYYDVNDEQWMLSTKSSWDITYDANGNVETTIVSVNDANGDWILSDRESFTYDASGVLTEAIFEEWDDNAEEWVLSIRGINPVWHDQDEFLVSSVYIEAWDGNAWVPATRLTAEYHADNTIEMELEEAWDDVAEEYVNDYLVERDIDANMVPTSDISYNWDEVEGEWVISWGNTYTNTYNGDDELEEQIQVYWNSFEEEWLTNLKYIYSYVDIASVADLDMHTVNIYPNPTTEKVTIQSENNLDHVTIVGMNGQVFYSLNNINSLSHEVDVQFLNAGTYFVISKDQEGIAKSKLIVQ
jgi:hypothetical protein